MKEVLPEMKRRKYGRFINIGSKMFEDGAISKFFQPSPRHLGRLRGAVPNRKGSGKPKASSSTYLRILSPRGRPAERHGSLSKSVESALGAGSRGFESFLPDHCFQ